MVVDDNVAARGLMARALGTQPDIFVVASSANGATAIQTAARVPLDAVVLDTEMPGVDGGVALQGLLARQPPHLSVVMASAQTTSGAGIALQALQHGALECVAKPDEGARTIPEFRRDLVRKVRLLGALARRRRGMAIPKGIDLGGAPSRALLRGEAQFAPECLAIAGSGMALPALLALTGALPRDLGIPVLVTLHMARIFTPALVQCLAEASGWPVREARTGDLLQPGQILVAPGNRHLKVERVGGSRPSCRLSEEPPENNCRPSADPMLRTLARSFGSSLMSVILGGIGQDGLAGSRAVVEAGGTVLVQSDSTCAVGDMPRAIAEAALCSAIAPPEDLARHVIRGLRMPPAQAVAQWQRRAA